MTNKFLLSFALFILVTSFAYAEAVSAVPPPSVNPASPAPAGAMTSAPPPQTGPHISTDIRLVTLDASGALDESSKKIIDGLTQEGWRPTSMSTVSSSPVTLAIMFSKMSVPPRPVMPQRPPQPLPSAPAPVPMPSAPVVPVPAVPAPAIRAPAAQPKP